MLVFPVQIAPSIIENIFVLIHLGNFFFIDLLVYFRFGCLLLFGFYFAIFLLIYKYRLSGSGLFSLFTVPSIV